MGLSVGRVKGLCQFYLVNWKTVCELIQFGSASIRTFVHSNYALLGKWLWWCATEIILYGNIRYVVVKKYGSDLGDWASGVLKETYGVSF